MGVIFKEEFEAIPKKKCDVLIIGSGIAGLTAALDLNEFNIILVTKAKIRDSSTWYAQGGVAVAVNINDSTDLHKKDTLKAGAGLCIPEAVEVLVEEGLSRVDDLNSLGVRFDYINGKVDLNIEGGHSVKRVMHSGDSTGSAIQKELVKKVSLNENVKIFENWIAVDLMVIDGKCRGTVGIDYQGEPEIIQARAVILASGGVGQLYEITTNPKIATGDGLSMAYRAKVKLRDLEFIQFHPTALGNSRQPKFLITEALRGEGAYLRDCKGKRFMLNAHPDAELAPRDVVTREIVEAMKFCGDDHVWLDARRIDPELLFRKFPTIMKTCKEDGFDLTKEMIPVQPAAHFFIGGIKTDLQGKTNLPGLYCCGEAASTGVHGANRLASNSLLEGLVFSRRISEEIKLELQDIKDNELKPILYKNLEYPLGRITTPPISKVDLQKYITKYAGLIRNRDGLAYLIDYLGEIKKKGHIAKNRKEIELGNMAEAANLIAEFALNREESRGVHYRSDFPIMDEKKWKRHQVYPFE